MQKSVPPRLARARRRPAALLAGAALVAILSGCAGGGDAPDPGATGIGSDPGRTGSTLEDIQARGVINIGVGLTTPPFGLKDDNGQPAGFDIDLANDFADYLGVEANLFEVSADARIPTLQSGQADLISFTLTVTPERQEQVDFAETGAINAFQGVAVPEDSDIESIDELENAVIAVQKGTRGEALADATFPNATKQYYDTQVATLLAVQQGQADATIDGVFQLTYKVNEDGSGLRVLDGLVDGDEVSTYALATQKGNSTLLDELNAFMEQWHADGRGVELYEKWFGTEPPAEAFEGLED
jgi:ABC-type amino acid transport substrate-binding protein